MSITLYVAQTPDAGETIFPVGVMPTPGGAVFSSDAVAFSENAQWARRVPLYQSRKPTQVLCNNTFGPDRLGALGRVEASFDFE